MRRTAAIMLCLASTGCLFWSGQRIPNLVESGAQPTLVSRPRIEMVLHHVHTMDGKDAGGAATDATYKAFKESLGRVQEETPFLANSGMGIAKPDFVLDLETEVAEHGKTGAIVSGASLMLIPGFARSDVIVRANLKDAGGRTIGHYEASGELKGIFHLLLLPALPVMPFILPGEELYDDTFRDLFLLMEEDLAKNAS